MSLLLTPTRLKRLIEAGTSIPKDYCQITETGIIFHYYNGNEIKKVQMESGLELGELLKKHGVVDSLKVNGSMVALIKNVSLNVITDKGGPAEYSRAVEYKIEHLHITTTQAFDICVSLEIDRVNKVMGNAVTNKSAKIISMQINHLKVAQV